LAALKGLGGAVSLAACLACAPASAQDLRAGKSELSASPVYTLGKHYGFQSGAGAKTDSGFGLGIQWRHNFDGHWSSGLDLETGGADYTGTAVPSDPNAGPEFSFDTHIRTTTLRLAFDYNFSTAQFTPFVTGGVGLAFVDANLPTSSATGACVWYPYWGQICGGSVPTGTLVQLSYSGGVGVRYDLRPEPIFFRALYDTAWVEYGSSGGRKTSPQFRLDIGIRF
jgi:opacity protein-like surface antigen